MHLRYMYMHYIYAIGSYYGYIQYIIEDYT